MNYRQLMILSTVTGSVMWIVLIYLFPWMVFVFVGLCVLIFIYGIWRRRHDVL